MLFTSPEFLILLLATLALYYATGSRRAQIAVLTAASFVFYAWESPGLVFLLLMSIAINVVTSHRIACGAPELRKAWAVAGVVLNLGTLLFFKYSPLFAKSFLGGDHGSVGHFLMHIPLPIGVSFFTFQGISLVVETFRGERPGDQGKIVPASFRQHLWNTMLFKSFFPSLVAGPIVKAHEFYPQIGVKRLSEIRWQTAFRALATGYFLKMVVADNLKDVTMWIEYPYFVGLAPGALVALLFGYSMQIFADFAGYSLIAIGLAALFGYNLPVNFNDPYISRSFSEFWRRWHISLSTWLKEYLYLPLGGNRHGEVRTYLNLFVVMFLGGLWHGAAWSYAVWGTFHGLALAAERIARDHVRLPKHPLVQVLRALIVFGFVTFAWLFFKLPDIRHVGAFVGALVAGHGMGDGTMVAHVLWFSLPVIGYTAWRLAARRLEGMRRWEPVAFGLMLAALIVDSGSAGTFIYFQF